MDSNHLEFQNQVHDAEIPFNMCDTLTIPPELPFLQVIENKTQEVNELDDVKPKLKTERTEDENNLPLMSNDFACGPNKFSSNFDANQIPGFLTQPGQLGMIDPNHIDNYKIPRKPATRHSENWLSQTDIQALLNPENSRFKLPADTRGPVDIRNIPSNPSKE